jgi:hypothetical protein
VGWQMPTVQQWAAQPPWNYAAPPVPDLPAWATMQEFGFAQPEDVYGQPMTATAPLFPGSESPPPIPSTLDPIHHPQLNNFWQVQTAMGMTQETEQEQRRLPVLRSGHDPRCAGYIRAECGQIVH